VRAVSDPARPRSSARADIWNIPNALTMSRVAMIPVVLYYVTAGTPRDAVIAGWLYGATAVTDLLDGYLLLGRELSITSLRAIAANEGVVIAAGEGGKWKAAIQMVGILCLVLHFRYPVVPFYPHPVDLNLCGQWLVVLSMVFSVTSAVEYTRLFVAAVDAKERRQQGS
jgi:CDP-diacylglycerol--glycerol-3-phosphate 3-phosphatidyltransferase